ncbi:MAG: DUF5686 and carboxypeptidase regulatory-like domain-containing protein, partial [Rikenellaceae bacterium]|nr:DUF5686 and carboxypeptidase regulatory-like domain-containing protein [Rikenellaceae bacterium]
MRYWRSIGGMVVILLWCGIISAQTTRLRGRVTDASTGEPIPFASISFMGTTIGTTADMEGHYNLETRDTVTRLHVTFLSYEPQTVTVTPGAFQQLDFALVPVITEIEQVVVRFDNPANAVMRNVVRNKTRNNPAEKESYQYSAYTKMELDMANLERFRNRRLQRNFGFVFEYLDTSALNGRTYLPVMITESTTDHYFRRNPRLNHEVVKASRISGVDDYNFAQFTGGLYIDVNLYDNYINIFEVNVPSPLCDHGRTFYDYFLIDSLELDERKTYYLLFHPKHLGSPVFDGEIYIDAEDWALHSAKMRLAKGINVNWLRDLFLENTNQRIDDSTWFKKQDRIMADLSLTMSDSSKLISFMVQRQIDYSEVKINEPIPVEIVKLRNNIHLDRGVLNDDENYWSQVRPHALSDRERGIYQMVDSVKNVPLFRNIYDLINTIAVGYQHAGPVEVGFLYTLFSYNDLEGGRVQLNGRTTKDFSEKIRLSAYGAYGFKDHRFKGGGGVEYLFNGQPTRKLTLSGKQDVLQLSASNSLLAQGNLLSSVFSRGDTKRLILLNQIKAHYEQEWNPGLTNTFSVEWREMLPSKYVPFIRTEGGRLFHIVSTEATLGTRISRDEIIHRKPFTKYRLGSEYPIFNIELTAGLKEVFDSGYEYYRTVVNMEYNFNIPPLGRSRMNATTGKIFGKVPYPLLKIHEGNATYFYDGGAFSCMDFYEFASDTWAQVMYEHHFRGFFLGRIPLLKRLQWREVILCKALWGSISDKNDGSKPGNQAVLRFPESMSSVSKPYIETGFGIE